MNNDVEKFNFLWKTDYPEEEFEEILAEYPDLWKSYYLQQEVAKKYAK